MIAGYDLHHGQEIIMTIDIREGYRVEPFFDDPPARKIRPSKCAMTGYHSSRKTGKSNETESALEHDFLTLLEFDEKVEKYSVQPVTLRWTSNGRDWVYTPDVIVRYTETARALNSSLKPTIFEVKPMEVLQARWKEFEPKFRRAIAWSRSRGMRFKIVTEKHIRTPFLLNVKFLSGFLPETFPRHPTEELDEAYVIKSLRALESCTPKELIIYMSEFRSRQIELIPWIWRLIVENKIGADLTKPLTMASRIWHLPVSEEKGELS